MERFRDFTYDQDVWAELPELVDELHSDNVKLTLILVNNLLLYEDNYLTLYCCYSIPRYKVCVEYWLPTFYIHIPYIFQLYTIHIRIVEFQNTPQYSFSFLLNKIAFISLSVNLILFLSLRSSRSHVYIIYPHSLCFYQFEVTSFSLNNIP